MTTAQIGIIIFLFIGCIAPNVPENRELSYDEFINGARATNGVVIDARTPAEYQAGHLPNAVLIDFNAYDFIENLEELDRDGHYFLYCRSGNRTRKALLVMQALDFKNTYHLKGGIIAVNLENVLVTD